MSSWAQILPWILVFFVGASIGSFITVLVGRFEGRADVKGRSRCPGCRVSLSWLELIPVVSFIMLRGRCRTCHIQIPRWYMSAELVSGSVFLGLFLSRGSLLSLDMIILWAISSVLLVLFFFDLKFFLLPDVIIGTLLALTAVYIVRGNGPFVSTFISGFFLALIFAILYVLSHGRWMGWGDVKLVFVVGILLGYPLSVVAVVLAIWVAALWGMMLLAFRRATLKGQLQFGSYLVAAVLVTIIFEHGIITFARSLFAY